MPICILHGCIAEWICTSRIIDLAKSPGGHIPDFPIRVIFEGFNEGVNCPGISQFAKCFSSLQPNISIFIL